MLYYTSEINVNGSNLIKKIEKDWKDSSKKEESEEYIKKMFKDVDVGGLYELFYRFPKGSHVCIRQITTTNYCIDIYSNSYKRILIDLLSVSNRLSNLGIPYLPINNEIVIGKKSIFKFFINSLTEGGGLIALFPPIFSLILKKFFENDITLNGISIVLTLIIYIPIYIIIKEREEYN